MEIGMKPLINQNNNIDEYIKRYSKKGNHKSKEELSHVEKIKKELSNTNIKIPMGRGARLLANGEIKISKRILKKIKTGNSSTFIEYDFSEKYLEKTREDALFELTRSSCIGEGKLLQTCEHDFIVAPDFFGIFKNVEIKRIYISYWDCKHNINILKNRKSSLTKCKNKIEKSYLEMTKYLEFREKIFDKVELYLYDVYEELYTALAKEEVGYKNPAIEKLEKLEKLFNEEGYDLNDYKI